MTMRRNILVTGATGKQGQALIRALLHPSSAPASEPSDYTYHIHALTRNASSPTAILLSENQSHLTLVEGDLDVPDSIRKVFETAKQDDGDSDGQGIWGVFTVLAFPGLGAQADGEERQGKMLADLALEYGVECFVYSSAMRSGPKYEDVMRLSGRAKGNVERYCGVLGERGLGWTVLRPGFFMENFSGFIGSITTAVLKAGLKDDTTNGLIATDDIGNVAAAVFRDPEKYRFQTLAVIAEYATMAKMEEAHRRAKGKSMPAVPWALGWLLLKVNKATQGLIQDVERSHYARTSGEYPECEKELELARSACKMKNYEEWLVQGRDAEENSENWNQVSVGKLLTGKL
ncbi:NAD(P)-binding protein [Cadophora sp. DSE1049]|nr:NAD(P)-binding protein [Cadophora sp. DSE1049]